MLKLSSFLFFFFSLFFFSLSYSFLFLFPLSLFFLFVFSPYPFLPTKFGPCLQAAWSSLSHLFSWCLSSSKPLLVVSEHHRLCLHPRHLHYCQLGHFLCHMIDPWQKTSFVLSYSLLTRFRLSEVVIVTDDFDNSTDNNVVYIPRKFIHFCEEWRLN